MRRAPGQVVSSIVFVAVPVPVPPRAVPSSAAAAPPLRTRVSSVLSLASALALATLFLVGLWSAAVAVCPDTASHRSNWSGPCPYGGTLWTLAPVVYQGEQCSVLGLALAAAVCPPPADVYLYGGGRVCVAVAAARACFSGT